MTAVAPSRPLRSIAFFMAGWVLIRTLTLLSGDFLPGNVEAAPTVVISEIQSRITKAAIKTPVATTASLLYEIENTLRFKTATGSVAVLRPVHSARQPVAIKIEYSGFSVAGLSEIAVALLPVALPSDDLATAFATDKEKRWSASAWLLIREGDSNALSSGGELGGSQAGARLFYDLAPNIAATGRFSRPLARAEGGEASVGVAIRHRNIGFLIERRIALDTGGRNDFSVTAYGGISDVAIGKIARLDGYAQFGIVGTDKFVDGATRVERTITNVGQAQISVGGGAWGGAQPGVERIDVGPQIVAHLPIEGRAMRVSAEWRERVLGNAAPISGPSLTIGLDL